MPGWEVFSLAMICHIVGAGPFCPWGPQPQPGDLLIAADGGYAHLSRWGLMPDLVVGDFDSGPKPAHPQVISLPREKDVTDTWAAAQLGRERGYSVFYIYGGLGGQLDHTLANIQLLCHMADAGEQGYLVDGQVAVTAVAKARCCLPPTLRGRVSIFAQGGEATGVTLSGFHYPLSEACLSSLMPLGVSNEAVGPAPWVQVRAGRLVILYPRLGPTGWSCQFLPL